MTGRMGSRGIGILLFLAVLVVIVSVGCMTKPVPYRAYLGLEVTMSPEKGRPLGEVAVLIINGKSARVRCIRGVGLYVRGGGLTSIDEIHFREGEYTIEIRAYRHVAEAGRVNAITNEYKKGHVYSIQFDEDHWYIGEEGTVQEWARLHPEYENATGDWEELRTQ